MWLSAGARAATVPLLIGETERTAQLRLQQDGMNVQRPDCLSLIARAQSRGKVVVVGGPDATWGQKEGQVSSGIPDLLA